MKDKYIAIKVRNFGYWLWFDCAKVKRENGRFVGEAGWGKGGAFTNIDIDASQIIGEINSDTLQYGS